MKLVEAAPVAGALRFELVSDGRQGTDMARPQRNERQQQYVAAQRQKPESAMSGDPCDRRQTPRPNE